MNYSSKYNFYKKQHVCEEDMKTVRKVPATSQNVTELVDQAPIQNCRVHNFNQCYTKLRLTILNKQRTRNAKQTLTEARLRKREIIFFRKIIIKHIYLVYE